MMSKNIEMDEITIDAEQSSENKEAGSRRRQVRFDSKTTKEIDEMGFDAEQLPENKEPGSRKRQSRHAEEIDESTNREEHTDENKKAEEAGNLGGPIGVDIGTTNIVVAQNNGKNIRTVKQLNAFFAIPYSKIIKKSLLKDDIPFFERSNQFYILGYSAEEFATTHGANTRRPVESGLVNPKEEDGIDVIKAIIDSVIRRPQKKGETICFSVPGEPIDRAISTVFHESIIKMHLQSVGYSPISINEGLSVVLSELPENNYTGIGISIGGGMCNICLSYVSVPVITYSIQKGGDYIDSMVGSAVSEPATKIKVIKEEQLDLSVEPRNKIETGLHIYYDDLFSILVQSLQKVLGTSDNIPRISSKIPIVLSGGSVAPKGCREKFEKALSNISLPVKISDIRIAEKPLYATARGSLKMAMEEGNI